MKHVFASLKKFFSKLLSLRGVVFFDSKKKYFETGRKEEKAATWQSRSFTFRKTLGFFKGASPLVLIRKLASADSFRIPSIGIAMTFLFFPFSASADEFWSEELEFSGGYIEIPGESFTAVSFDMPEGVELEFYHDYDWKHIHKDGDRKTSVENPLNPLNQGEVYRSELVFWGTDEPFMIRAEGNAPATITAHFSAFSSAQQSNPTLAASAYVEDLKIISRSEWGADESWRFNSKSKLENVEQRSEGEEVLTAKQKECKAMQASYPDEYDVDSTEYTEKGKTLIWPHQYSKQIRKVVIHHSAGSGEGSNIPSDQIMRAIYQYHTKSRLWGDVGYHYAIGPDGKIFEGRSGGDYVVGGHVYCNNIGTIGIVLMGNFTDEHPTNAQISALGKLLPRISRKYSLDLTAEESYHGQESWNLLGHRDLSATACPGEHLYGFIPHLRDFLKDSDATEYVQKFTIDGEPVGSLPIKKLRPGQQETVNVAFKNTGNTNWDSTTWLFANAGEGITIQSVVPHRSYVAAKMKEKRVEPGETAHFKVILEGGYTGGLSTVSFVPVVNERRVTNAKTLQLVEVSEPNWGGKLSEIRTYPKTPVNGKSTSVSFRVKNTGDTRWKADQVQIALSVVGKEENILLELTENILPGKTGMFSGKISPIMTPGTYIMRGNMLVGENPTSIRFVETLEVKESKNSAEKLEFPKKVTKVNSGEVFVFGIQYLNTGNDEWTKDNMKVEVLHRNVKKAFLLQEDRVLPGEKGNFIIELDTKEKVQPYIVVLRDGIQKLRSDVFFLLGTHSDNPSDSDNPGLKSGVIGISETKDIRIKLSYPKGGSSIDITSGGNFSLSNAEGKVLKNFSADAPVSLSKKGDLVQYGDSSSSVMRLNPKENSAFEILSWQRYPSWDSQKRWNDNLFLGSLEIRVENGELIVVNELPLETYLLGIAEVPEAEHPEKKKAISVVARSYVLHYLDEENRKFPGRPYDGSDDPAVFQKYLGANYIRRAPGWRLSVLATKGEVVKYKNEVVKTPFHSCSGGKTLSAEEVWGWQDIPYLISLPDPGGVGKSKSGHGVGLSGCGAQYFAEEGKDYLEILKYYYPGTVVE